VASSLKRLRQRLITGSSNVAAKTGNIYISGIMTDGIEIPTANLGFSSMLSLTKVSLRDSDNDREPKMAV